MDLYAIALALHIAAGTVALVTFWSAGLMRKGTPLHRRIGQAYLLAMVAVILTGVPLVQAALARGQWVGAAFLAYLLLLVTTACWSAWRAIRDRRDPQRYFGPVMWLLSALLLVAGAAIVWLGTRVDSALLMVFGGVGVLAGLGTFGSRRRALRDRDPKWWLKEHYGAMIGNGVATHIAFFGIGLRNALPGVDPAVLQSFAWFTPLAGAVLAGWWLNRRYGRAAPRRTGAPAPAHS